MMIKSHKIKKPTLGKPIIRVSKEEYEDWDVGNSKEWKVVDYDIAAEYIFIQKVYNDE